MRSGRTSQKNKDVTFQEAVRDLDTRPQFIRREQLFPRFLAETDGHDSWQTDLQKLQILTNVFVQAITTSTRKMPYGMRSIARETLVALKVYCAASLTRSVFNST